MNQLIKETKRGTSVIFANIRELFTHCDCNNSNTYIKYNKINRNDMWEYQIRCDYCGEILFDTQKKR